VTRNEAYDRVLETSGFFNFGAFYDEVAAERGWTMFAEVGVWHGHSLVHLAKALRARGGEFELWGIDLWNGLRSIVSGETLTAGALAMKEAREIFEYHLEREGVADDVMALREVSWAAADVFGFGELDFVFIDAGHDYPSVSRDLAAWWPKVAPGGMMAGHDLPHEGVRRAVTEKFGDAFGRHRKSGSVWTVRRKA